MRHPEQAPAASMNLTDKLFLIRKGFRQCEGEGKKHGQGGYWERIPWQGQFGLAEDNI